MPRPGVSYEVVAAAAGRLVARGQAEVSVNDVRAELTSTLPPGTPIGSPNTIQRHLAAWRVTAMPVHAAEVPGMPAGLASQFVRELTRAADEARAAAEQRLQQLQGDVAELVAGGEQLEERVDQLQQELAEANGSRSRMSGQLDERTSELSDARGRLIETSGRLQTAETELQAARVAAIEANGRLEEVRAAAERTRAEDRAALQAAQAQVAHLTTQLASANVDLARANTRLESHEIQIHDQFSELKVARENGVKAKEMEARYQGSYTAINALERHVATLTETIAQLTARPAKAPAADGKTKAKPGAAGKAEG